MSLLSLSLLSNYRCSLYGSVSVSELNKLSLASDKPQGGRGGTFQVWNFKKLKECSNFGILEGTYAMYFELTGRNV